MKTLTGKFDYLSSVYGDSELKSLIQLNQLDKTEKLFKWAKFAAKTLSGFIIEKSFSPKPKFLEKFLEISNFQNNRKFLICDP